MSQRKMLQFSTGALLLLFGGLVTGEVYVHFSRCNKFFYEKQPPWGITGEKYKPICQKYEGEYRFATLYNTMNRAPLYSAYIISDGQGKRTGDEPWMYEPQLVSEKNSPEMQHFTTPVDQNVMESQAVDEDYRQSSFYTRGHLNPVLHQKTPDDRNATFTLTNIVPQRLGSNNGPWNTLETNTLDRFMTYCTGTMYVITGALPFQPSKPGSTVKTINNRVSVPEYLWSAYCCRSFTSPLPDGNNNNKPRFPTYAALGRNDPDSDESIVPKNPNLLPQFRDYNVREMSLEELEGILKDRLKNKHLRLFKNDCKQK